MAHDRQLAAILRADLAELDGIREKPMFGGLGFLLNGNLVCGTHPGGALYRVGRAQEVAALAIQGAAPLAFTGRRLPGFVEVTAELLGDETRRVRLLALALDFVRGLPAQVAWTEKDL